MSDLHDRWLNKIDIIGIIIISCLAFCLLPTGIFVVQRGPSRRSACQNNLRQLVLAATNFESTTNRLPANRQSRDTSNGTITVGWVYELLPYIEEQHLYDALKRDAAHPTANNTKISLLQCPHDPTVVRSTDCSYLVNGGCPNNPLDNFDTCANGVGDDLAGDYRPETRARMTDVKDGTTTTFYYVENLNAQRWNEDYYHPKDQSREYFHAINWIPVDEPDLSNVFLSNHVMQSTRQLWAINEGDPTGIGPAYSRPSSYHPLGFQAAFVGGQTRFLAETIDYSVYARLLSSDGHKTLNPSDQRKLTTDAIRQWQGIPLSPQDYE